MHSIMYVCGVRISAGTHTNVHTEAQRQHQVSFLNGAPVFGFCFSFAYIVAVCGQTGATLAEIRGQLGGASSHLPFTSQESKAGKCFYPLNHLCLTPNTFLFEAKSSTEPKISWNQLQLDHDVLV